MGFEAILGIFDERQVRQMADAFKGEWEAKCLEKRRWCVDHGKDVQLDTDYREVLRLLSLCANAYQIAALRELVFIEEVVPLWNHVEAAANAQLTRALT
jgi:hypothetical protein